VRILRLDGSRKVRVFTSTILVTAVLAWVIVLAGAASAATACAYDRGSRTIHVSIDPGQWASLTVETAGDDLDQQSAPEAILFNANGVGFEAGAASAQCGIATVANAVAVVVTGQPAADETFFIDEYVTSARFPSSITWSVDLGSNTSGVGGGDLFGWTGNDGPSGPAASAPFDDTMVLSDGSFELNGAKGQLAGVELVSVVAGAGDDVLDGSALVNVRMLAIGGDGDDWIAPGRVGTNAATGDDPKGDVVRGNTGVDTLSYATRTDATVIDNRFELAGHDADGDCDLNDVGDERDILMDPFEVLVTGSGSDCLIGDVGIAEVPSEHFIAGAGNDRIWGDDGNDVIRAGAGGDILRGGAGNDRLFGGPGHDLGNGGPGTNLCFSVEVRKHCEKA
jgi:Ca2+-binding RTX toxin-like protein